MNKGDLCKPRAGEMARLVKVLATKSDDPGTHIEKTDYSKLSSDFLTPSPYPMLKKKINNNNNNNPEVMCNGTHL